MENELLIRKAKKGDKDALVELIMQNKQEYYKLAYVYMKNKDDALDALEDMIVALYENIDRLRKTDAFYSYSKTILVNCCKTALKKKNKVVLLEENDIEGTYIDEDKNDDKVLLEYYLSQLDEKHQEVIKLRYFMDMDYQSIADILKIPLGTVKSRLSVGLSMLKQCFGGEKVEGNQ